MRSRGSFKLHKFKSPTCAPSTIEMRQMLPAGIYHQHRPEEQCQVKGVGDKIKGNLRYLPCLTRANWDSKILNEFTTLRLTHFIVESFIHLRKTLIRSSSRIHVLLTHLLRNTWD